MERPEDYNCYDHEKEFIEMIKNSMLARMKELNERTKDPQELGFELTEYENVNGSWYCSNWKATQDLSWFFSVFQKYQEWWLDNFGEALEIVNSNGFFETEKVHLALMIDAHKNMFDRAYNILCNEDINYNWENKIEVTEDFINKIKKIINENFFEIEDIF